MMRNFCKANICFLLFALSTLLFASSPEAKVAGNCNNCHTMHNSQGGEPVARGDAPWGGTGGSTDARPSLLLASCLGCHSSTLANESIREFGVNKIPIVFNTTGYPSFPLAGGNFFSVMTDDTKGHNIFAQDTYLSVAPGDPGLSGTCGGVTNSCHKNLYGVVSGMGPGLDGKQGCEKCHLNPKHHADDHGPAGGLVTSAEQGWYRFLSGHSTGEPYGVEGYEDGDWQKTFSSVDHNEYLGNQIAGYGFIMLGNTTTAYCTGCHGQFHINQGTASPWLRHPSDVELPVSGEYANYINIDYNPWVPVARPSLSGPPSSDVSPGDMVMCLSCHRAHASPYSKIMRWDYKAWPGMGVDGCDPSTGKHGCCNVCHSSKN